MATRSERQGGMFGQATTTTTAATAPGAEATTKRAAATATGQGQATAPASEATKDPQLLDQVLEQTCASLDASTGRWVQVLTNPEIGPLYRAMVAAAALERLRAALDDRIMAHVMQLQNTKLGFATDRDPAKGKQPYPVEVVKEVVIAALLEGLDWTGNQFNIISGGLFITQRGWARKLKDLEGFSNLQLANSAPYVHGGICLVRFVAKWRYQGNPDALVSPDGNPGRPFSIKVDSGTGDDAKVGKGLRKCLKAIYEQCTGSAHTLDEADEVGDGTEDLIMKPANGQGGPPPLAEGRRDLLKRPEQTNGGSGNQATLSGQAIPTPSAQATGITQATSGGTTATAQPAREPGEDG